MRKGWQDSVDMESISFWPDYTHKHTHTHTHLSKTLSFPFFLSFFLFSSLWSFRFDMHCGWAGLSLLLSLSLFCYCLSLISRLYNLPKKKEKRVSEWWKDKSSVSFWRGLLLHKNSRPIIFRQCLTLKAFPRQLLKRRAIKPYSYGLNKNSPLGAMTEGLLFFCL